MVKRAGRPRVLTAHDATLGMDCHRGSGIYMTASDSETYLARLAGRTFLGLWTYSNPYHNVGKELTDLIVPFGNDIIIFSDKAVEFDAAIEPRLAWQRWSSRAVADSIRQLRTAKQRIERDGARVFLNAKASIRLPFDLPATDRCCFHLVAIARPARDPALVPNLWPGLTYASDTTGEPFHIGPLSAAGVPVHLFDGRTIDLLLGELDTAPDFIAYLSGRAERLAVASRYRFVEQDLLAAAIENWAYGDGLRPTVPPFEQVRQGHWEQFARSERRLRSQGMNKSSHIIDRLISSHDNEYQEGRSIGEASPFPAHEYAMRLLAGESRFARRIIVTEILDVARNPSARFMGTTLPSPSHPDLRYVWLAYPEPPANVDTVVLEKSIQTYLRKHVLVARGLFHEPLVMGVALPQSGVSNTALYFELLDGSDWTPSDVEQALALRDDEGIFADLERIQRFHAP
jgi:hypothetical protein